MAITYDAPSNTITVTGYTEETPCMFEDIYQADQAGGWGVVTKQGGVQYAFDARLKIGNGSTETWFADTEVQVVILSTAISGNNQFLIEIKRYGNLRFGILLDAENKLSYKGVQIIAGFTQWGIALVYSFRDTLLEIYSCHFVNTYRVGGRDLRVHNRYATMKVYNSILDGCKLEPLDGGLGGSNDIYDVEVKNSNYGVDRPLGSTIDRIFLYNNDYHLYMYTNYVADVSNLIGKNAGTKSLYMREISVDPHLINCEFDSWDFYWHGTSTAEVYRQYEFDVHCQDKEGNDLSGVSAVGEYISPYGQAFSEKTDVNGNIPTQTVDRSWYEQATGNTENLKTPLKVTYKKTGYQTVVKYYSMDQKTEDTVVMHKAVSVFLDFGRPVINLKKTDPENKNVMVVG